MYALDITIISITSLSAFFDLKVRRIPNWLIATGLANGLAVSALQGWDSVFQSLLGLAVGIGVLLLPFAMGWVGAGDVKLFGVLGAILGVAFLPRVFFYSAIVAGVIAIGSLLSNKVQFFSFKQIWLDVRMAIISMGKVFPQPVAQRAANAGGSVPWGVAFAAGALIAYYFDFDGKWAGF